jgi:AcrR family transcriptional regulator
MPGPTPLRADARHNRERLLEAARTSFAADGLSVPLDEIARSAGAGPGTLYRHFPTKEALIEAVAHDRMCRLAAEGTALRESADPGAAFFAFIERLAAADDLRAQITCLLARAQRVGDVRADIGSAELTALLSGILFAMRPRPGTDQPLVLSVFRDGLRPQARPQHA